VPRTVMQELFTPQGMAALQALAKRRAALVFDFDGTLAPLVAVPDDARVSVSTAAKLQALSALWPVAVITGRAVSDVQDRLGFQPLHLYGNHGAEPQGQGATPPSRALARSLDPVRQHLKRSSAALQSLGIEVEDKTLSLALHYRRAANPNLARQHLQASLQPHHEGVRVQEGHLVLNLTPAHAPDKGDALLAVLEACQVDVALVIGDDANDEPAFAKAPAGSVSVRVGVGLPTSAAMYTLAQQGEVDVLLDALLRLNRAGP
jgi:trehalose 6-phosphate phosphatase